MNTCMRNMHFSRLKSISVVLFKGGNCYTDMCFSTTGSCMYLAELSKATISHVHKKHFWLAVFSGVNHFCT